MREQISSMVLGYMRTIAEAYLGTTVAVYFNATKDAGIILYFIFYIYIPSANL